MIGYDTRPSSLGLVEAARRGVAAVGGRSDVRGLLTTPQLHWMVRQHNRAMPCTEADYYSTLGQAFQRLVEGKQPLAGVRPCVGAAHSQEGYNLHPGFCAWRSALCQIRLVRLGLRT